MLKVIFVFLAPLLLACGPSGKEAKPSIDYQSLSENAFQKMRLLV
jgi:hypothetical protein